jgi:hypothetical protein
VSASEIIKELPKLSEAERRAIRGGLLEIANQDGDVALCNQAALDGALMLDRMEDEDARHQSGWVGWSISGWPPRFVLRSSWLANPRQTSSILWQWCCIPPRCVAPVGTEHSEAVPETGRVSPATGPDHFYSQTSAAARHFDYWRNESCSERAEKSTPHLK